MGVPERKMIIPDGMLGKMPFEALLTRSDYSPAVSQWPFLVREALLWRAYSLDVWHQLQEQPRVAREYERDFAGFFVSFDGMENGGGLVSLLAVQREMEMLRDEVPGGDFFWERNDTIREFFESFGGLSVVHMSTHAFLFGAKDRKKAV